MNPLWQDHLLAAGAVIQDGIVAHFGNPQQALQATGNGTIVADLSHLGMIRFSGEDSQTFLQGQFTNDTRLATREQAQHSALCTPKGRMLANFLLWQDEGGYLLQLPAALRESVQQRLAKYVLRAKVKSQDASEELVRLGVAGENAEALLEQAVGALPQSVLGITHHNRASIIRLSALRFEVVLPADAAPALWNTLAKTCPPAGSGCWEWLEIRAGIPAILPPTQELFTPQMANLETLGGISFTKGCYTGQEVVARTQYLGKVKRHLHLAHIADGSAPQPGDDVLGIGPEGEMQVAGQVVNAQTAPGGGYDLLAVITTSTVEAGSVHWKSTDGPLLAFLPLPRHG